MSQHPELFYPLNLSLTEKDKIIIYNLLNSFEPNCIKMPNFTESQIPQDFKNIECFSKILEVTKGQVGLTIFFQDGIQYHPHIDRHRSAVKTNYRLPWRINFFVEQRVNSVMHWYETLKGREHYWTRDTTIMQSPWMDNDVNYHYGEHPIWYKARSPFETFPPSIWSVDLDGLTSALVNTSIIHTVQQPNFGRRLTCSFYSQGSLYWDDIVKILNDTKILF